MAKSVRQGLAFSIPGFHLGIMRMTRSASLSSKGCMDFSSLIFTMEPSLLTIKETTTLPSICCCCAKMGYFRFLVSHFINSTIPPGNSGSCSTIRKLTGFSSSMGI